MAKGGQIISCESHIDSYYLTKHFRPPLCISLMWLKMILFPVYTVRLVVSQSLSSTKATVFRWYIDHLISFKFNLSNTKINYISSEVKVRRVQAKAGSIACLLVITCMVPGSSKVR